MYEPSKASEPSALGAEYRALDKVPKNARSFGFSDQFVLWFGAASIPAAWYYGALMAGWVGLPGALLLIFGINTVVLIPWAYLGHIAGRTGAASMALVRPAFGLRGSILPSVFYLIFGFGWSAFNVFVGSIALSHIFHLMFVWPAFLEPGYRPYMAASILVVCSLQGLFAAAGHQWIRWLAWTALVALIVLGAYQTLIAFGTLGAGNLLAWHPLSQLHASEGPIGYTITLPLLIDLLIAYNWTWQFIGDFSRFARTPRIGTWGPFVGVNLAQYWWFLIGAAGVVYVVLTTGQYTPQAVDPGTAAARLGFGWGAALVILMVTLTCNAGNIYSAAIGISNIWSSARRSVRILLTFVALLVLPLSLLPLASAEFVGLYIFYLDFLAAIVVPLWTITLIDYFLIRCRQYGDDLFLTHGGAYWYDHGWHWAAIIPLVFGTVLYWVIAYGLPTVRQTITAAAPTAAVVGAFYYLLNKHLFHSSCRGHHHWFSYPRFPRRRTYTCPRILDSQWWGSDFVVCHNLSSPD